MTCNFFSFSSFSRFFVQIDHEENLGRQAIGAPCSEGHCRLFCTCVPYMFYRVSSYLLPFCLYLLMGVFFFIVSHSFFFFNNNLSIIKIRIFLDLTLQCPLVLYLSVNRFT
jgi:ABC-type multidrug transport system permease subunit